MPICSLATFHNAAAARSQEDVARDLAKATTAAVTTYKNGGMSALAMKTQECYERKMKDHFYCVYLDLASRHIDQNMAEAMQFPQNEFFADEEFGARIGPVLAAANMDMDTANEYLASITPVINGLVDKKLSNRK